MQFKVFYKTRNKILNKISQIKQEGGTALLVAWILYGCFLLAICVTYFSYTIFNEIIPLFPRGLDDLTSWALDSQYISFKIFGIPFQEVEGALLMLYGLSEVFGWPYSGRLIFHIYGIIYLLIDLAATTAIIILDVPVLYYTAYLWILMFADILLLAFNIFKVYLHMRKKNIKK